MGVVGGHYGGRVPTPTPSPVDCFRAYVARGVIAKMERRNPHVFGDAVATDAAEVLMLWNAAKAAEKRRG